MKRITQFDGLYGEVDARPDGEYLFSERLETRSHAFDWVILPHTHARLFQLFFVESGGVELAEASQKRQFSGSVLLLIPPLRCTASLHARCYRSNPDGVRHAPQSFVSA